MINFIDQMSKECHEESEAVMKQWPKSRHGEQNTRGFTPTSLVLETLKHLPVELFYDGERTFRDPNCGNGQFLACVAILKKNLPWCEQVDTCWLSSLYGVDSNPDKIHECRTRLLRIAGVTPENIAIVEKNIVCRDGPEYDYTFSRGTYEEGTTTKGHY